MNSSNLKSKLPPPHSLGDNGETTLSSGDLVSKASPLLEVIGNLDYLNAMLGEIRCLFINYENRILLGIQENLVLIETKIGISDRKSSDDFDETLVSLEKEISRLFNLIPSLKEFVMAQNFEKNYILGGTTLLEAKILQARAICNKLERELIKIHSIAKIDQSVLKFINRLSDYLYLLARYSVHLEYKKPSKYKMNKASGGSSLDLGDTDTKINNKSESIIRRSFSITSIPTSAVRSKTPGATPSVKKDKVGSEKKESKIPTLSLSSLSLSNEPKTVKKQ